MIKIINPVPKPSFKRRVPKRAKRNEFSTKVRKQILERDNYHCQMCKGRGEEIHHVFLKSRGGRGVFTNGLTLCGSCHRKVHNDNELIDYWIDVFTDRYGYGFWMDEYDR